MTMVYVALLIASIFPSCSFVQQVPTMMLQASPAALALCPTGMIPWFSSSSRILLDCSWMPVKQTKGKTLRALVTLFFFFFTDFYVGHINLPSCLFLSNTLVELGGFLGTSPGNAGIKPSSITTPLSVVPLETAESPRPSSLLPVSSYQSYSINTAAVQNV